MTRWIRFSTVETVLAVAGMIVAALLTSFHYSHATEGRFCSGVGGCATVNTSAYSVIGPVPVAILGLAEYATILVVVLAALRIAAVNRWAPLMVFGLSFVGVLFSAYLTYLELFVIRAICPWCVVSAVVITLIWLTALFELHARGYRPTLRRAA